MTDAGVVEWVAAGLLALVAVAHSVLGERSILVPLFTQTGWELADIPRWAAERILRFAWHLTSIAWWALAAALVGLPVSYAFAATCLSAAVVILVMLPGHLAWPMFLAAGALALWGADAVPAWLLWTAVAASVVAALIAAGFHVAWAFGSRAGAANVLPQRAGTAAPTFVPSAAPTLAVAILLLTFAALVGAEAFGLADAWIGWMVIAAFVVLALRVIGDGRWVGVTKSVRDTGFARADDRYWTPAAALLAMGAASALALAA